MTVAAKSHRMNINEPQACDCTRSGKGQLGQARPFKGRNFIEHLQFHILKERRQSPFRTRNTWNYDNAAEVCK